jgi:hypothetical protein
VRFSGSRQRAGGENATIMVESEPQKSLPELSDSLVHRPLRVNDRVTTGSPRQPPRTAPTLAGALHGAEKRLWGVGQIGLNIVRSQNEACGGRSDRT